MSRELTVVVKKTAWGIKKRLLNSLNGIILALVVIIIIALFVFIVKPNFDIFDNRETEDEEDDFGEKFGNPARLLLIISIIPLILWIYFRELLQYFLSSTIVYINKNTSINRWEDKEPEKVSKKYYITTRKLLLNIHCIGCIISCGLISLHMIGLFNSHNGFSFLLPYIALILGIYISITGLIIRFPWKKKTNGMRKIKKISRMVHFQLLVSIIGIIIIQTHT